ncbi:MAG: ferrous iron transporter B, partial [Clostridia bacterium]|nr:ferrous iron transporter B [Clostridia bacterium]
MKIALTGNPNSGKTTMFNALTGRSEKVGNWAGVTVDKKEGIIKKVYYSGEEKLVAVDLPGAYSMSPFTSEESVTRDYIKNENPDVIINIVDATNLSRSLFFTTQILELGIPTVVALNKSDINKKRKTKIDVEALSKLLGCPVIETNSVSSDGLKNLISAVIENSKTIQKAPYNQGDIEYKNKRAVIAADRKRYAFVNQIVKSVETRKTFAKNKNLSDKIDDILTNKWLGIPIFAVVMWLVFQISQVWVGQPVADYLVLHLENIQGAIGELFSNANPFLYALLVDGVIGGVIAVIG